MYKIENSIKNSYFRANFLGSENLKTKSLLAIEVVSAAFAYKMLNEIVENSWLEIVEISSGSNAKNLLIFQSNDFQKIRILKQRIEDKYGQPTRRIFEVFSPQLFDLCLVKDLHPDILPALVALVQNPIEEGLVIFEAESVCASISALQTALKTYALKTCDLRLFRQSGGMNHLFLTGTIKNCEEAAAALKQQILANYLVGHVELVANPSSKLREHFSLSK